MIKVASIGNANVDLLLYLDELPPRGGQVEARGAERRAGGAAANFAVAAAKLGLRASFIG
ncbi:MAG: carbohydrate kinase family protein, partial [Thermoprotei archaeon]